MVCSEETFARLTGDSGFITMGVILKKDVSDASVQKIYDLVLGKNLDDTFIDQIEVAYLRSDNLKYKDSTGTTHVNRLFLNALWGQKGNFLDIPTDCPQRDERMGWTGDAQAPAAARPRGQRIHAPQ